MAKSYIPYQLLENKQMLHDLLTTPNDFLNHVRRYSTALTTTMVFGWRNPTYSEPKLDQFFENFDRFAQLNQTGTAALIDFFPLLRWLLDWLLPAQKTAKKLHEKEKQLYLNLWLAAKQQTKTGSLPPCFCVGMAQAQLEDHFSDDQAAYISGTLLEAGADTTSSTLYGFIQAMVLFPDVQEKAQEEIDRVVGADRLPTMDDEPNLQYIRGCVKESLRWMPTTILGAVPHSVTRDDEYNGYHIPKGAGVMNNVWAIHMDPTRYPEPRRFEPERFKDDFLNVAESAAIPDVAKRDAFTFGAGRRICPGMHVAERSLFLGIARMLWAFDFRPAVDAKTGEEMLPDPESLTQGFVCMPEEFEARITPRDEKRAELVEREWTEAKEGLLDPMTMQWRVLPEGMQLPGS